jgi:hypothetical protein
MMPAVRRRSPLGYNQAFEITRLFLSGALARGLQRAARLQELLDGSERCPVPRVASESTVLLPPLHNAGARHRMAGSDSGDRTSSFAALVDSADAPATRAPRAPANRAAPASNRSQRPSGAPAAKNESTPDRANAADAAPEASQPKNWQPKNSQPKKEPGATDGPETQTDSPDEKGTQDATASATDLLGSLTATVVDGAAPAPPVPTPPAAPLSVDAALTAQSSPDGESSGVASTRAAAPDASTAPAAQSATPEGEPAVDQPTADGQPATPEQAAPSSAAADTSETTPTADGKAAAETDQQHTATNASQAPAPAASEKLTAEQAASKPLTPSEQQPTHAQPDAATAPAGKRPTSKPDSTSADARKSDAATALEDNEGKTAVPTGAEDPAAPADHPIHAPRRAHAEASSIEDKQAPALAAGGHEAGLKAPAESFQAILLANDPASAAATRPAAASTNDTMEPAVPIAGLAVEIAARAQAGQNRFEIRLDPPELGRIDVRLDIDGSGQVTSRLVVERADTLEHLRRDAAGLERALQDAGLKTGENSLQFSLRDQGFAGRDDNSQ